MSELQDQSESRPDPTTERIRTILLKGSRGQFSDRYDEIVLEQYSLYVEMADRISARRHSANSYFLAVNSLLVALSGYLAGQLEGGPGRKTRQLC